MMHLPATSSKPIYFSTATNLQQVSNAIEGPFLRSLHLHQHVLGQPRYLDTTPRRLGLTKELGVELVERYKVIHGFEKDDAFEDVGWGGGGCSEDGGDVGKDLFLCSCQLGPP